MIYAVKKMVNGYRNTGFQLVLFIKRPFHSCAFNRFFF